MWLGYCDIDKPLKILIFRDFGQGLDSKLWKREDKIYIRPLNVNKNGARCPSRVTYESIATVGESRVWWRADFQSGSRVLKKVF